MVKNGFTMIELIIVIVISAILSLGVMVGVKKIYLKSLRVKQMSRLSLDSQIIADKIANLLFDRIPSTALGYNPKNNSYKSIYQILDTDKMSIFEWEVEATELKNSRIYSGFVDFENSDSSTNMLFSPDTNGTILNSIKNNIALIFAGAYDMGDEVSMNFNTLFGWHNSTSTKLYTIANAIDENITLNEHPNRIFEKYYLIDSAYAIARGEDLNQSDFITNCGNLGFNLTDIKHFENAFFLFFDYRPWRGETFCADPNSGTNGTPAGKVMLLSQNVTGFNLLTTPSNELKFNITMQGDTKGSEFNVTISKQKIIF